MISNKVTGTNDIWISVLVKLRPQARHKFAN
jgi:hypothetical protein